MKQQAFGCVKKNNNCVEQEHTRKELMDNRVSENDFSTLLELKGFLKNPVKPLKSFAVLRKIICGSVHFAFLQVGSRGNRISGCEFRPAKS
jgi:hypothetical protein